jgi:hypothetical protein
MGMTATASQLKTLNKTGIMTAAPQKKNFMSVKKLTDAPIRLLKEIDINQIYNQLCQKCRSHCDGFVHLTCGRGG